LSLEVNKGRNITSFAELKSTDSFRYVWECFGIDPLEQLIQERQDTFNKKYSARDNVLCFVIGRY